MLKNILLGIVILLLLAGGAFTYWMGGPSMVVGGRSWIGNPADHPPEDWPLMPGTCRRC